MDKKSKILFIIFGLLITGSVATTYWRIMIKKDYIIEAQVDCDPMTETCFVWKCDSESTVEGEACTGDKEKDVYNYKIIRRNAGNIPLCDPDDESCAYLVCGENEPECEYINCTEENKIAQKVECSVPEESGAKEENSFVDNVEALCAEGEDCVPIVSDGADVTTDAEATSSEVIE